MYPISVTVSDGAVSHVYDVVEIGKNRAVRKDTTATVDLPVTVTVSHQTSGADFASKQRSLLRWDKTVEDADSRQGVISAYLVVEQPTKIATQAQVLKVLAEMTAFLAVSGYKERLLNGEI